MVRKLGPHLSPDGPGSASPPGNDPCAADGSFHLGPMVSALGLVVARLEGLRDARCQLLGLLGRLVGQQLVLRHRLLLALLLALCALLVGRETALVLALGAGADLVCVHVAIVSAALPRQTECGREDSNLHGLSPNGT